MAGSRIWFTASACGRGLIACSGSIPEHIDRRLPAVGPDRLFEAESKRLIHDFTGSNCRQINNIAVACTLQARSINAENKQTLRLIKK